MRVRHCEIIALLTALTVCPLHAQRVPPTAEWKGAFGMLAFLAPRYEGSDEYRLVPLPFVQVTYRDRLYVGPSTSGVGGAIGAYLVRTGRASVSVESGISDSRPSDRSGALTGMDDRGAIASVSSTMTYAIGAFEGAATVSQGLNGDAGAVAGVQLRVLRRFGRVAIRTAIGASWADASEMRRSFGVTDAEASRRQAMIAAGDSRLRDDDGRAYSPAGGLKMIGGSVFALYPISKRWSLLGWATANRLSDAVIRSPLVRQRGQLSLAVGAGRQLFGGTRTDARAEDDKR